MTSQDFIFKKIMIVDDTKIDRYIASHVMKKNNFVEEVMEYDMATKAIEFLESHQNQPEALPEVILLDISMPEMDGFQFLERLSLLPQSIKQSCCIVMLSSSLNPVDHERADNNPIVKKFINKPLGKVDLDQIRELYTEKILSVPV